MIEWLKNKLIFHEKRKLREEMLEYYDRKTSLLEREWYERKKLLEATYEPMKRELAYWHKVALEEALLKPIPPIVISIPNN